MKNTLISLLIIAAILSVFAVLAIGLKRSVITNFSQVASKKFKVTELTAPSDEFITGYELNSRRDKIYFTTCTQQSNGDQGQTCRMKIYQASTSGVVENSLDTGIFVESYLSPKSLIPLSDGRMVFAAMRNNKDELYYIEASGLERAGEELGFHHSRWFVEGAVDRLEELNFQPWMSINDRDNSFIFDRQCKVGGIDGCAITKETLSWKGVTLDDMRNVYIGFNSSWSFITNNGKLVISSGGDSRNQKYYILEQL